MKGINEIIKAFLTFVLFSLKSFKYLIKMRILTTKLIKYVNVHKTKNRPKKPIDKRICSFCDK